MLMDNRLLHFLYYRLAGWGIATVRAGVGEINGLAVRTDLFYLSGFYATVRTEAAVKLSAAVLTDMQKHSRAAGRAMLYTVFNLCATELTSLQLSFPP